MSKREQQPFQKFLYQRPVFPCLIIEGNAHINGFVNVFENLFFNAMAGTDECDLVHIAKTAVIEIGRPDRENLAINE